MEHVAETDFEVVRVIGLHWLIDSRSRLRTYYQPGRQPLALAYYVVGRPADAVSQGYNEAAVFCGPYEQSSEAHAARERLMRRVPDADGKRETPALLRS